MEQIIVIRHRAPLPLNPRQGSTSWTTHQANERIGGCMASLLTARADYTDRYLKTMQTIAREALTKDQYGYRLNEVKDMLAKRVKNIDSLERMVRKHYNAGDNIFFTYAPSYRSIDVMFSPLDLSDYHNVVRVWEDREIKQRILDQDGCEAYSEGPGRTFDEVMSFFKRMREALSYDEAEVDLQNAITSATHVHRNATHYAKDAERRVAQCTEKLMRLIDPDWLKQQIEEADAALIEAKEALEQRQTELDSAVETLKSLGVTVDSEATQ